MATPILGITEMTEGQEEKYVTFNEAMAILDAQAIYMIGMTFVDTPIASEEVIRHPAAVAFNLPVSLTNSQFKAGTAATAETIFTLKKNGGSIGTVTFAIGGTSASVVFTAATAFAVGDIFTVTAPGSPDATIANLGFTIKGTR
jgi:hypothetical protein